MDTPSQKLSMGLGWFCPLVWIKGNLMLLHRIISETAVLFQFYGTTSLCLFLFQQESAPIHQVKSIQKWLKCFPSAVSGLHLTSCLLLSAAIFFHIKSLHWSNKLRLWRKHLQLPVKWVVCWSEGCYFHPWFTLGSRSGNAYLRSRLAMWSVLPSVCKYIAL